MSRVFSCYPNFHNFGGAQKMLMYVHHALLEKGKNSYVIGRTLFSNLHDEYSIQQSRYKRFSVIWILQLSKQDIVLSHHRRLTAILFPFSKMLGFTLIHVAHSVFETRKIFSIFPLHIIAVSHCVKDNLVKYFEVSENTIQVIYNGIPDKCKKINFSNIENDTDIHIFYPARVCELKRQIELVQQLQGKLDPRIKIVFAGDGPDFEKLNNICSALPNFEVVGHVSNLEQLFKKTHLVMLFSQKEGLPLSLIESTMYGKPVISNGAGGSIETFLPDRSGFLCCDYPALINCLNALVNISNQAYFAMCQQSRALYENKFSFEGMINSYCQYIQHCRDVC